MAMNRENFIRALLPTRGLYALFAKHKDQEFPKQTFYQTISDLLAATEDYDDYDLYCGIATFKEKGNRTQANVEEIKAFFLDLDAKDFGSKKDAFIALQKFLKDTGLPAPALVDSGRGIHVYWILDKAIDGNQWTKLADKLKELCAQHAFKADPAVTSDVARVMRIPGTFNHKEQDPIPCKVKRFDPNQELLSVEKFADLIGHTYIEEPILQMPAGFEHLEDSLTDKLSGNLEASFKTIMKKTQEGKGCKQLANAVVNNASLDEPTWRGALSIAVRCVDNSIAMRKVSEKHPDYSESATRKKADETKGPYTCEMFNNLNRGVCDNCPNNGKIKSPIVLGHQLAEPKKDEDDEYVEVTKIVRDGIVRGEVTAKIPAPPKGYAYGKEGGVYLKSQDADGNPDFKLVCKHTLYIADRTYDDIEHSEALVARVHLPHDGVRTFSITNAQVSSSDKLREELAKKGVLANNQTELRRYIMAWVDHYQQTTVAKKPVRQFGWQDKDCTQFVLGETLYTENGPMLSLPSARTTPYLSYFESKGNLQGWVDNMKFWDDPRYVQQQLGVGLGVGSILMQRDNVNGAIMHLGGKSGVGKSAVAKAALSLWGNPKELMMHFEDTKASSMNRAEVWNNIPFVLDEITNISPTEASQLIYQMTNGKQRNRMNNATNEERVRGGTWSLIAITTGNMSLVDKVMGRGGKSAPEAEAQRVIEMEVKKQFEQSDFEQSRAAGNFEAELSSHYGVAGPVVVEWIIKNPIETDMIIAKVREAVEKRAKLVIANRFWTAGATYAIAGLVILKKLGLVNYDPKNVLRYIVQDLLPYNKQRIADMRTSATQTISEYLAENLGSFLQIRDDSDVTQTADGNIIPPDQKVNIKLLGRYESDKGRLYILISKFREWCVDRQISYSALCADLKQEFPETESKSCRLGTGTKLKLGSSKALIIPWKQGIDGDDN